MMKDRISKPERQAAKRLWPLECHRHGVNKTARKLRDGWGPIRFTFTATEMKGGVWPPMTTMFGKVTVVRDDD